MRSAKPIGSPVDNESRGSVRMKACPLIVFALILAFGPGAPVAVNAQTGVPAELADGLGAFQQGELDRALELFQAARARDDIPAWRGHALFWVARTQMALGEYDAAADTFDRFLDAYAEHPYLEEASYQRARIFQIQGATEAAIRRFADFTEAFPRSAFYPNALYWTGEALFTLGRLSEAERLFAEVTDNYPTSFRVEAARYRLDIIELSRREDELLRLLQWSHEEYLAAIETFQQRERSYQEALRSYRTRLAGLATDDFQAEIETLSARIAELEENLAERDERINFLLSELRLAREQSGAPTASAPTASAPTGAPPVETPGAPSATPEQVTATPSASEFELRESLLSLKAQALELQELILEQREEDR